MPMTSCCCCISSVMDETSSSLFVANLNKALGPAYVGEGLPEVCKTSQTCSGTMMLLCSTSRHHHSSVSPKRKSRRRISRA
jgi:hypothetical protein